jgi:hypothetical protein
MKFLKGIIWSEERRKWLCYDDALIDLVVNSNNFVVPTYDYSDLEIKLNKNFEFTKQVINHFPLANEGDNHLDLRNRMIQDINSNLEKAIGVFRNSFIDKILAIKQTSGSINIAAPITESILESNWAFANIDIAESIDYSDLTLMLDDSQSIKSRLLREEFIKNLASKFEEKDRFYKLALLSVGVNALISTTLHSFIKVMANYNYESLIIRKYFYSNGIKHLERVCSQDAVIGGNKIKVGEKLRLYVGGYEQGNYLDSQKMKNFFAIGSDHACIGMNYSLSIWKELIGVFRDNFSDMQIVGFDYRSNDGIFNFPTNIFVEYSK